MAGTDDDFRRVGFGVSSGFTVACWCIFFKLPLDGLPDGLSSASWSCLGLLLCGGLDADTTAGLDIGFVDIDDTVVVAADGSVLISSFFTVDGLAETLGMLLVLMSPSFGAVAEDFKSSFFNL